MSCNSQSLGDGYRAVLRFRVVSRKTVANFRLLHSPTLLGASVPAKGKSLSLRFTRRSESSEHADHEEREGMQPSAEFGLFTLVLLFVVVHGQSILLHSHSSFACIRRFNHLNKLLNHFPPLLLLYHISLT